MCYFFLRHGVHKINHMKLKPSFGAFRPHEMDEAYSVAPGALRQLSHRHSSLRCC